MPSIYEINAELQGLINAIELSDGELSLELAEQLAINDENYAQKVESYLHVRTNKLAYIDSVNTEIKRLEAQKKLAQSVVDRLESTIDDAIAQRVDRAEVKGKNRLQFGTYTIGYRSSESVQIEDVGNLPSDYIKQTPTAKKTEIKNALKAGVSIDGCSLVAKQSMQVK